MTVTGVDKLKSKLAKMPALVEMRAKAAMEKGADEIVAMMKRLVPVKSGELRDSIGWTWGEVPSGASVVAESVEARPGLKLTIYAGDEVAYYARWVEFGTAPHNVAKKGGTVAGKKQLAAGGGVGHPGMRAHPFFFPAYRALKDRTKRRVISASRKALKEVAAGGR